MYNEAEHTAESQNDKEIIEVLIPSAVTNDFESVVRAGLCYIT